jgi:group I intron endonuclease
VKFQDLHYKDKLCGVYSITHIDSGRLYIGSSINLYKRLIKHKSDLNAKRHHSPVLQNAWNKYGESGFEMKVLELVSDPQSLLEIEQNWLNKVNPFYNICKTAGNRLGFKASEETKLKLSKALKGKPKTPEHIEKMRIRNTGKKMSAEARAKCGRKGQKKPDGFGDKIRAANIGRKMSETGVEKMAETKRKEYIFVSPEGVEFVSKGLRKFCREHNLNPTSMCAIANNKPHFLQHKGWKCKYKPQAV